MQSQDLLHRVRRLDAAALGEIHDRYYPEVYRYVRYRLDDESACEDIAGEVFLRFLDALHKKRGPTENLRGWLFGTASNLVNDHLRKRYAHKLDSLEDGERDIPDGQHLEKSYEDEWMQQQVLEALRDLTFEQQHVLALRFSDERSLDETANIMGKSVTAVKALQFRAVASLRRLVEERTSR